MEILIMEQDVVKVDGLKELAARAKIIYEKKLKKRLEPQYNGQIVAIEADSGDWFLGESVADAAIKAKEKYPEKMFHFIRVGYRAVHKLR
jgi:hypothetical protein